ncbi:Protein N-terminal glutamine amidohydrolase [Macleaya cordata]|uniref:Protein N-terminal glutamine amidohydrolase n=1 Tax=Macleaya cordata TaxID=56857 RepID=A0A200PRM5_MACCD|nr:Protein N-terminal glutamine amidohydrolase [Macleaya cordata]
MGSPSNLGSPSKLAFDISTFDHTPSYCEENVYRLCKKLMTIGVADADGKDLFVVFISNKNKQVPLWHQKASKRGDGLTLWDYHVICVQQNGEDNTHQVWDLDSSLPFPSPLTHYVSEAIRPSFQLYHGYQRLFRVVHAPNFLRFFATDRRHMKDSVGNWISQPPPFEPVVAEDGTVHNLDEYIQIISSSSDSDDFSAIAVHTEKLGVVVSEDKLENFFSLTYLVDR